MKSGSPPRVRGKVHPLNWFISCNRITPACAGKSYCSLVVVLTILDHPRVCGEKCKPERNLLRNWGSPPRVRGKVAGVLALGALCGITPACAGKSKTPLNTPTITRDHPRVCGEKFPVFERGEINGGSPPRVRGKEPHFFDF